MPPSSGPNLQLPTVGTRLRLDEPASLSREGVTSGSQSFAAGDTFVFAGSDGIMATVRHITSGDRFTLAPRQVNLLFSVVSGGATPTPKGKPVPSNLRGMPATGPSVRVPAITQSRTAPPVGKWPLPKKSVKMTLSDKVAALVDVPPRTLAEGNRRVTEAIYYLARLHAKHAIQGAEEFFQYDLPQEIANAKAELEVLKSEDGLRHLPAGGETTIDLPRLGPVGQKRSISIWHRPMRYSAPGLWNVGRLYDGKPLVQATHNTPAAALEFDAALAQVLSWLDNGIRMGEKALENYQKDGDSESKARQKFLDELPSTPKSLPGGSRKRVWFDLPIHLDGWRYNEVLQNAPQHARFPRTVHVEVFPEEYSGDGEERSGHYDPNTNAIALFVPAIQYDDLSLLEKDITTTLGVFEHELTHMVQFLLGRAKNIPRTDSKQYKPLGLPGKTYEDNHDIEHAQRDIEFYPNLVSEIHAFNNARTNPSDRETREQRAQRWVQTGYRFNALRKKSPENYRKFVREFIKAVTDQKTPQRLPNRILDRQTRNREEREEQARLEKTVSDKTLAHWIARGFISNEAWFQDAGWKTWREWLRNQSDEQIAMVLENEYAIAKQIPYMVNGDPIDILPLLSRLRARLGIEYDPVSQRGASIKITAGRKTLDRLLKQNPQDEGLLRALAEGDPTGNHDWLEWMYKVTKAESADAAEVIKLVNEFDKYKSEIKEWHRQLDESVSEHSKLQKVRVPANLFEYKSLSQLNSAIATLRSEGVRPRLRKKDADYTTVHQDARVTIYHVKNKEASCVLGADSDWCSSKWNQNWYEERKKSIGGETYIARLANGNAYMVRVVNGLVVTAYDKSDAAVVGTNFDERHVPQEVFDEFADIEELMKEVGIVKWLSEGERSQEQKKALKELVMSKPSIADYDKFIAEFHVSLGNLVFAVLDAGVDVESLAGYLLTKKVSTVSDTLGGERYMIQPLIPYFLASSTHAAFGAMYLDREEIAGLSAEQVSNIITSAEQGPLSERLLTYLLEERPEGVSQLIPTLLQRAYRPNVNWTKVEFSEQDFWALAKSEHHVWQNLAYRLSKDPKIARYLAVHGTDFTKGEIARTTKDRGVLQLIAQQHGAGAYAAFKRLRAEHADADPFEVQEEGKGRIRELIEELQSPSVMRGLQENGIDIAEIIDLLEQNKFDRAQTAAALQLRRLGEDPSDPETIKRDSARNILTGIGFFGNPYTRTASVKLAAARPTLRLKRDGYQTHTALYNGYRVMLRKELVVVPGIYPNGKRQMREGRWVVYLDGEKRDNVRTLSEAKKAVLKLCKTPKPETPSAPPPPPEQAQSITVPAIEPAPEVPAPPATPLETEADFKKIAPPSPTQGAPRIANLRKRSADGAFLRLRGKERNRYAEEAYALYEKTYAQIGVNISSAADMLASADVWDLAIHKGAVVAGSLCKATKWGLKAVALFQDGTQAGKLFARTLMSRGFSSPGMYAEVSHTVEALSKDAPKIPTAQAAEILGKSMEPDEDGVHYWREVKNVGRVRKMLVGLPQMTPDGDPNNKRNVEDKTRLLDKTSADDVDEDHAQSLVMEQLLTDDGFGPDDETSPTVTASWATVRRDSAFVDALRLTAPKVVEASAQPTVQEGQVQPKKTTFRRIASLQFKSPPKTAATLPASDGTVVRLTDVKPGDKVRFLEAFTVGDSSVQADEIGTVVSTDPNSNPVTVSVEVLLTSYEQLEERIIAVPTKLLEVLKAPSTIDRGNVV